MKDKDKISGIYRKRVEALPDDQASLDFADPLNQQEADEIWDEISAELDIDEVWDGISSGLDRVMPVNPGSGILFKSLALALILFTMVVLVRVVIPDPGKIRSDEVIISKQHDRSPALIIQSEPVNTKTKMQEKASIPPVKERTSDKYAYARPAVQAADDITGQPQVEAISLASGDLSPDLSVPEQKPEYPDIFPHLVPVEETMAVPLLYPVKPLRIVELSMADQDGLKIYGQSQGHRPVIPFNYVHRLSIGIITVFKNTWLLNEETLEGLKPETLTTTLIEYNYDVGLSLNYALNPAWSIQSDGFFCSNTGQEYYEYIYGHYSRKQITLEYLTIALSAKHKFFGRGRLIRRSSVNLLAGGYVSLLQNASQKINKDLKSIGSHYDKLDYGVRLGAEIELPLYKHVFLAPGLFMSIGLPDISKDGNSAPDSYRLNTRNGSAGFHLAFYFH